MFAHGKPMIPALTATQSSGELFATTLPLQFFTGEFITLAVVFFVLAILAALVGARGVAGMSMSIAKWFVIIFIVLAVVSLVL